MYGYQGYTPGQSTTYTTSAAVANALNAYAAAPNNTVLPQPAVFGYPGATPSTFTAGLDAGLAGGSSNPYYSYGYGTPAAAATYSGIGASANYAALSDLSYASKGRAPYGATAPKPNPALTTLTTANKPISSYGSTYDAAVFAAASTMIHKGGHAGGGVGGQTFPAKKKNPFAFPHSGVGGVAGGGGGAPTHKYGTNKRWGVGASASTHRDAQQFYCEVCKISCAGQLTYKEHLEGKLHKKKEALSKGEGTQALPRSKVSFRCDLCNVTCTGKDTYDAHVRGSKHQRTLALCKKLGKPIPVGEPTVIPPAEMGGKLPPPVGGAAAAAAAGGGAAASKIPTIGAAVAGKKIAPVHFVGGSSLETTKQTKDLEAKKAAVAAAVGSAGDEAAAAAAADCKKEVEYDLNALLAADSKVKPVGESYVETERDANGKHLTYVCKLCDCKFSDINAKDIHLKGRRHRLQYKQKVDPTLEVEVKPNNMREKRAGGRVRNDISAGRYRGGPGVPTIGGMGGGGGPGGPPMLMTHNPMARFAPAMPPRPYFDNIRYAETEDDRHIMAKHAELAPTDEKMKEVEELVQAIEMSLKDLSDHYHEGKSATDERLVKGAMRIGFLSRGLLLKEEEEVQVVTLFSSPPTTKILEESPEHIKRFLKVPDVSIEVMADEASLIFTVKDKLPRVRVYFTSTSLRQDGASEKVEKPTDCLNEEKCLHALAELRRSKWFQAKCAMLQSCHVVLRCLRDVAKRIDTYKKLSPWMTELIVEKVIYSVGVPIPVGDALRRFFEAISTGILFESGPGVIDPCEKDASDVLVPLSAQDRENITSSAQHALRLIAFGQIHKILGMEKLAPPVVVAPSPPNTERKRRAEEQQDGTDGDQDAKKDKLDETEAVETKEEVGEKEAEKEGEKTQTEEGEKKAEESAPEAATVPIMKVKVENIKMETF